MRKAVIHTGKYTVTERTCGGWAVLARGKEQPISLHDDADEAHAAAQRYIAEDAHPNY